MPSIVITPSTGSVLTFDEVAQQCRLDDDAERSYVEQVLIPSVSSMFEQYTRCKLLSTVMEDAHAEWPCSGRLDLAFGPVKEVSSVTYLDLAGASQILLASLYYVHSGSVRGVLHRLDTLPSMKCHPAALRVRYTAGFGDTADDVPACVKHWMLAHIASFMQNRESGGEAEFKVNSLFDGLIADYLYQSI
ncbi:hypothetical protein [Aquabacterium sp.]|uniref:head-tail connector protein n=1 Tax=Aquabacterium sp. TaxID=1872578 RepID=UPI0025C433CF|nr:hypothetical protein [Aquabacterium sp.]